MVAGPVHPDNQNSSTGAVSGAKVAARARRCFTRNAWRFMTGSDNDARGANGPSAGSSRRPAAPTSVRGAKKVEPHRGWRGGDGASCHAVASRLPVCFHHFSVD